MAKIVGVIAITSRANVYGAVVMDGAVAKTGYCPMAVMGHLVVKLDINVL